MTARAYFGLRQYRCAQRALEGVSKIASTLRLQSRIAWKLGQKLTAIDLNRAAYGIENRHDLDVLLQQEFFYFVSPSIFSPLPPAVQHMIAEYSIHPSRGMDPVVWDDESGY